MTDTTNVSSVIKALAGVIASGVATIGLSGCAGSHSTPLPHAHEPIPVTLAPVTMVDTAERLEGGGTVAAPETASVSSRIVAAIAGVRVKAGDRVRAGDVLVTLDAPDAIEQTRHARASALAAEQSLAQIRTASSAAEADHLLAAAWHKRILTLHARQSATDQERDEANARLDAAAAKVAGAQASVAAAEATLAAARSVVGAATAAESFATVRAPFDGLITERLTDPGNLAAPGVPLLRIESDGERQVIVRIDEARVTYVHPGDMVEVEIDGHDELLAGANPLRGVVAEVARAVGPEQRSFAVKVTVPGAVRARSGTFARVIFRGASRRALRVPAGAIRRHGQVSTVFVVQNGVARLRLVQPGRASAADIEILAGLDAGESVVASPVSSLADGDKVTTGAAPKLPEGTP